MTGWNMRAVVLHGKESAVLEDVPIRSAGSGEVRIRVERALTCGTDVKVFRRGHHARMITPPAVFGHEFAGVIEEVGPKVTNWHVGDRVVAANSAPCNRCYYCQLGREELCEDLQFFNGAFAEQAIVPARIVEKNMLLVDKCTPLECAAMSEPLACVVRGLEVAPLEAGATVVVLGLGPIGLMFVRLSVLAGCSVIAVGRRQTRLRLAEEFGALQTVDVDEHTDVLSQVRALTKGYGADMVIEAVGSPQAWTLAIDMVRKGGIVNLFGGCSSGSTITVDTTRLHYDEITLRASFHHTPRSFRRALQLIRSGDINASSFISTHISLTEVPATLQGLANGELDIIKACVVV